jgi:serine/threonine protein kinase/tetratricopeptide (TPR) repeat protein
VVSADRRRGPRQSPVARPKLAGKYQTVRELGRGGMGVVYQAIDVSGDRFVAIKMLSSALSGDLVALLRFKREARTASSLSHPNICAVYDFGESRGRPFIVMELLEGQTLKERLAQGSCDPLLVLDVAMQVAEGLGAAHTKFIVHRDIKPANIFLVKGGAVKILDFGIAKHFVRLETDSAPTVTKEGNTPGTVDYMSPEQLLGQRIDQRSDLFSLGVSLYEVLTSRTPFYGRTKLATMAAILHRSPAPLPAILHRDEWSHILARLLQKNPDDRYPNAAALVDDLALLKQVVIGRRVSWPIPRQAAVASPVPSVAIVPFEVVTDTVVSDKAISDDATSDEPESDERRRKLKYFSHGLMDELIAGLTRVAGLRVLPRTLALRSRPQRRNLSRVGRRFHADYVLAGEVSAKGERLAVNVAWYSSEDDKTLWSRNYELQVEDLFHLRDKIVAAIMDALQLTAADTAPATHVAGLNREAFHLCLKGRFYWSKRYEGGLRTAGQCFQQALAADPSSALAHAGLADTYSFLGFYCIVKPKRAFEIAAVSVAKALHLDPRLAEVHTSLGLLRLGHHWDWHGAAQAFRRAIELDSAHALSRIYLSWTHVLLGDTADAEAQAEAAQDIDPLSPNLNAGAAYTFYLSHSYERAIRECEKALEVDKQFLVALYVMGMCKAKLNMYEDAIKHLEVAAELSEGMPFYLGLLGKLYADTKQHDKVTAILARLDEKDKGTEVYVPPHCYVYIYAGLGDLDKAFAWQDRAFVDGASPFNYFSPIIDNLHGDPRFKEDIRKWGLEI